MDKGFDVVRNWLLSALRPYAKEAFEVIKEEHLLSNRGRASSPPEDGEASDSGGRATSPPAGSTTDPGSLSYFNQWCSQQHKHVDWKFHDIAGTKSTPLWSVEVWMDGTKLCEGVSTGKKGAKTEAAKKAMQTLGIAVGGFFLPSFQKASVVFRC